MASHASKRLAAAVAAELSSLYEKHHGLNPQLVVKWAKDHPRSALHSRFEWNNSKAAHAYRLWQARQLIVEVEVIYPDRKVRQVYVSPVQNRGSTGYVALVDVLGDRAKRAMFLEQALAELERVAEKYRDLKELAGVWKAIRGARRSRSNGRRKAA